MKTGRLRDAQAAGRGGAEGAEGPCADQGTVMVFVIELVSPPASFTVSVLL